MKKTTQIKKAGQIYIESEVSNYPSEKDGANYLRQLVIWMDNRNESLNENKSRIELIIEFNKHLGQ